jgi:hypothetical protein
MILNKTRNFLTKFVTLTATPVWCTFKPEAFSYLMRSLMHSTKV